MRLAFSIDAATRDDTTVRFFAAVGLTDGAGEAVYLNRQGDHSIWQADSIGGPSRRLMAYLDKAREAFSCNSPLMLVRTLVGLGAKQVVWDDAAEKFRNLASAQDGDNEYELVGTKLRVGAKDEASALTRAKARLMTAMDEAPEEAETLARWFKTKKLKIVTSGAVPDAIPVAKLARGQEEVALAAKPIEKLSMKDEE